MFKEGRMNKKKFYAVLTALFVAAALPETAFAGEMEPASYAEADNGDLVSIYEQALSDASREAPEDRYAEDDLAGVSTAGTEYIYRVYNPNSGEHFYTKNANEKNMLVSLGWRYEGVAWSALTEGGKPVYRLYNPNTGDHHYTLSAGERDAIVKVGWRDEGIAWYAEDTSDIPVYRLYNPNARTGIHHYTTSGGERGALIRIGWRDEGIGWYAADTDPGKVPVEFGQDGSTYSIQATVALNGTRVREDGGCIAKVVMPVNGDSASSFDVAYDYGMPNDTHTYFYLENIMSNAAEPGLKGKSYIRVGDVAYTAGTEVSIRLSWFESAHKLAGYVNDVKVCETSTPNGVPSGFMLEGGGKYNGDTVDAVFKNIVVNRRGTITHYPPFGSNCHTEAYNGLSAAFTSAGCHITGTTAIPDELNWDTIMSYNGHATSGYCVIGM